MKINKNKLHPLYEQYSNPENRLTHALLHTLGSSNWILLRFLKDFISVNKALIGKSFEVTTQKVPCGKGDTLPEETGSVPDAWIADEQKNLGIVIEVKCVKNSLKLKQLHCHVNQTKEYKHRLLLVITPDLQKPSKITRLENHKIKDLKIIWRSWDEVYCWVLALPITKEKTKERFLADALREYLERRKEVLGFTGFNIKDKFDVLTAKTTLDAVMEQLAPFVKKVYKDLSKRRPAITTSLSQEAVWDCFGVENGFTADLHLTLAIDEKSHTISLTIPNSAKKRWIRLKDIFSNLKEKERLFSILAKLRKEVPHLLVEFIQRHFIAQKFGVRDGHLEFDIDTLGARFSKKGSKTKAYSVWLPALEKAILEKNKINGQVMFISKYYFNETKRIDESEFINTVKRTIEVYKPLYDFLKG